MQYLSRFLIDPTQYTIAQWLFLRGLGLVYSIAFTSFAVQVTGLIGEQGILPVSQYLSAVKESAGHRAYWLVPSLAWINSSDRALLVFCWSGAALGLLLLFGLSSTPVLVLLWILYRSLMSVGQVFLGFQWDALLLEVGFLAIFTLPPSIVPPQAAGPVSPIVILLMRWLLFRLMFMSGLRKLVSRDPTWRNLTALAYHYETQPLPNPLAFYAFRAPNWFQKASTLMTHVIELLVPFLFFAPSPAREIAGILTILLQVLIMATGNFAFFNLLTIVIALPLFNDAIFQAFVPVPLLTLMPVPASNAFEWPLWVLIPVATFLIVAGALYIVMLLLPKRDLPRAADLLLAIAQTLEVIS